MKRPSPHKRTRRIALSLALALLLSLALSAAAFAQQEQEINDPNTPPGPLSGPPSGTPGGNPSGTPAPTTNPPGTTETSHPSAPFTPPGNCIVAHAATPAQLCPVGGGLQYYFIGPGGTSSGGPWIASFTELAGLYAAGGGVSLYSGSNPFTGKPVNIYYLPSENKLRISTYYPDNQYDVNKAYVFTVDTGNAIKNEAW